MEQGGYKEQLLQARLMSREPQPKETPMCPDCGKPMRLLTARKGRNAGSKFWGWSDYPACKGTREVGDDLTEQTDQTNRSDPSGQTARAVAGGLEARTRMEGTDS